MSLQGKGAYINASKIISAENPLPLPLQTKSAHIAQAMGWCATVASRTGSVSERAYTGNPERHCHIISPSTVSVAENGSQTATGQKGDNQSKETKKLIFHGRSDSKTTHRSYTILVFLYQKIPQKHQSLCGETNDNCKWQLSNPLIRQSKYPDLESTPLSHLLGSKEPMAHGKGSSLRWPYRRGITPLFHSFGIVFLHLL